MTDFLAPVLALAAGAGFVIMLWGRDEEAPTSEVDALRVRADRLEKEIDADLRHLKSPDAAEPRQAPGDQEERAGKPPPLV